MKIISILTPFASINIGLWIWLSFEFYLAGVVVALCGMWAFRKAQTTTNPLNPNKATSLVTNGIYKRTRNPMYFGMLLILLGFAIMQSNVVALLVLPAFVVYMNRYQILPEERVMQEKFGEDFAAYTERVRRWI